VGEKGDKIWFKACGKGFQVRGRRAEGFGRDPKGVLKTHHPKKKSKNTGKKVGIQAPVV